MSKGPLLQNRLKSFLLLGQFLQEFLDTSENPKRSFPKAWYTGLDAIVKGQVSFNAWFTEDSVLRALKEWSAVLNKSTLDLWLDGYPQLNESKTKWIAIVMAGNIPMVGFHDALCVLLSGNNLVMKPSSDDKHLIPYLLHFLEEHSPELKNCTRIADGKIIGFEAVIATGSTNSTRYFQYYFGKYPCLLRKGRTSIALLNGSESEQDLNGLADDILAFHGLGCRSVTKLFLPKGFDLDRLFKAIFPFQNIANQKAYGDNYDYHRSLFMLNKVKFLENGFFIVREEESLHSPVSVIHYSFYDNIESAKEEILLQEESIQLVIGNEIDWFPRKDSFGKAQSPKLNDYADGVDTMRFLAELK